MNLNDRKAYSEVITILSEMEEEYIQKIPQKVFKTLENNTLDGYEPIIEISRPLTEQNLNQKTFDLLACIYLNYWCENEEEKQRLLKIYSENEKKEKENFEIKFLENSKKEFDKVETEKNEKQILVIEEKNWFKKVIRKVYMFFKSKI